MVTEPLHQYAGAIETLVEGLTGRQIEPLLERMCAEGQWELMGVALITAGEVSARMMIECLVRAEQWAALVPGACLRRQMRPATLSAAGTLGANAFRDFDAEEGTTGVPEHIIAEAEDLAAAARTRRVAASVQAANLDRDPLRSMIIGRLAGSFLHHPEAVDALVTIARASAWEETRREAALKTVNTKGAIGRLVQAGRSADLVSVARATGLGAARQNVAGQMAQRLEAWQSAGDRVALEFIAENHAELGVQAQARDALGEASGPA